ncbi:MAG: VWA domain-containing protein [Candidatus Hydrogenedentes bacterium]|nr:VWA domain-containing protein [Candidatus Hydrogenedentota bacterium]
MKYVSVGLFALAAMTGFVLSGCREPKEAIILSKSVLDFGRDNLPIKMRVWNANPDVGTLTIRITPSDPWISVSPREITSTAPAAADGPFDEKLIEVRVDRTQLSAGSYTGEIRFSSRGIVEKTASVLVTQDQDGVPPGKLNFLSEPVPAYGAPYLVDFSFSLVDEKGDPIVAEPAQFQVSAKEDAKPVEAETEVHLKRSAARQLKMFLVLDYSLSMQTTTGAITAMEQAAQDILLPALNADALVGVYEFHRDDLEPAQVVDLTTDRDLVSDGIDSIQTEFVQGFSSGSRLWDAVIAAADHLGTIPNAAQEERIIVIFSDGSDTSSVNTLDDAIDVVMEADAHVYAIGFGSDVDESNLLFITLSTGGEVLPSSTTTELADRFQDLVDKLGARYVLRWATLKRSSAVFQPSFTLNLAGGAISHIEPELYRPSDYRGNELEGVLRLVPSENREYTTVFLRADYVPRQISRIRMYVRAQTPFTPSIVGAADDGLAGDWTLTAMQDSERGGVWITIQTVAGTLPFATFGPLLRFDFDGIVPDETPLFDQVYVDPSVYANGQSFRVVGYPNTPPGE